MCMLIVRAQMKDSVGRDPGLARSQTTGRPGATGVC